MYYYAIASAGWLCTSRGKDDGQSGSYGKNALLVIKVLAVNDRVAWILGRGRQNGVRPINELDIEHPLENVVYEELK